MTWVSARAPWRVVLAASACLALLAPAAAQEGPVVELHMPQAIGPSKPRPVAGWLVTCVSGARAAPVDCRTEQRVLLQTGQVVAVVTISVPHDTRKPTILVQVPFGLLIRAGITLQLDGRNPTKLDVQTCDQGGCYAATVMSDDFLKALLTARKLSVNIRGLNQQPLAVQVSLQGFSDAYARIR